MLRITVDESPTEQRWTLHGRLSGPWVAQLEDCWNSSQEERRGRSCVIDLTKLTSVDAQGEAVLQKMMNEGARFRACGVYVTHLLDNISQACRGSCS